MIVASYRVGAPRRLWAWARLIHVFPSMVVTGTGLGIGLATAPLGPVDALRLAGMVLGSQVFIGALNEYCDADSDRAGQPWKPIPSGLVPRNGALVLSLAGLAVCLGLSASFGLPALLIAVLGCTVGAAYDLLLKRTGWSWLPYVIDVPLLPVWVWSAVGRLTPELSWIYPAGGLLALSAHIANALPDDAHDRAAGTRTIVQQLGLPRSVWLLRLSFCAAAALGALVLLPTRTSEVVVGLGLSAVAIGLAGAFLIAREGRRRAAFRMIAVAAGLFGIAVAIALR